MDPLPTVKANNNDSKPKLNPKASRQNRVFGTARNVNIIGKPISEKPTITKSKFPVPQKQPKSIRAITQPPFDTSTKIDYSSADKKTPEENVNPKLNKKIDALPQRQAEIKASQEKKKDSDSAEPKTPVAFRAGNARGSKVAVATPFYTAVNCSKCRFDRLETASYWIGQIKTAESVGKHFVAADFFRLAVESQAEPIRSLRMELRRYLLRHEHLSEQKEWREVAAKYGLLKVESNICATLDSSSITESSSKNESENVTGVKIPADE